MTPSFVLATGNADKVREIIEILSTAFGEPLESMPIAGDGASAVVVGDARTLAQVAVRVVGTPDVAEIGGSLVANARIKAAAWCEATQLPAIADDTGLFVDALDGAPGVDTAYFAGPEATYAQNVEKLLCELADVPKAQRGAHFTTVALAVFPDGHEIVAEGRADGCIASDALGTTGFGFDPVFIPDDGDGRRFSEMSLNEKHTRSHRGRAFRALAGLLTADTRAASLVRKQG